MKISRDPAVLRYKYLLEREHEKSVDNDNNDDDDVTVTLKDYQVLIPGISCERKKVIDLLNLSSVQSSAESVSTNSFVERESILLINLLDPLSSSHTVFSEVTSLSRLGSFSILKSSTERQQS